MTAIWGSTPPPRTYSTSTATIFEDAQMVALQKLVRQYEEEQKRYAALLHNLARQIAPGKVDRSLTENPFAFDNFTPADWQTFFDNALNGLTPQGGPLSDAHLQQENRQLRERLADLEKRMAELQADRDRLQNAVITQRQSGVKSSPDKSPLPATPASPPPAPEQKNFLDIIIPKAPPRKYASLFSSGQKPKSRQRELIALALLAATGYSSEASLRWEVVQYCQRHATKTDIKKKQVAKDHDSGSIKRLFPRLERQKLLNRLPIEDGQKRIIINVITDLGRTVVQEMNLPIAEESEWERLMRLHGGERQQKHAAQVCLFAHYARKRGWTTQVCPEVTPPADPDVLIEKGRERIYVEVEAGSGTPERRMKKWRNMRNLQGFVAICAPSEAVRKSMVREARANSKRGKATDFIWLRNEALEKGLWAYTW